MTPESDAQRFAKFQATANDSLKDHVILKDTQDSWIIGKPGRSEFKAQIIATYNGALIVYGDVDIVCFAYGGTSDKLALLDWMANRVDFDWYVTQKASIGTGYDFVHTFSHEQALWDIDREIADLREEMTAAEDNDDDGAEWGRLQTKVETWEYIREFVYDGESAEEIQRQILEAFEDSELPGRIGRATATRVYWAWMILRKCWELVHGRKPVEVSP